jgi:NAD-dependent deacetylase sirtuin 4
MPRLADLLPQETHERASALSARPVKDRPARSTEDAHLAWASFRGKPVAEGLDPFRAQTYGGGVNPIVPATFGPSQEVQDLITLLKGHRVLVLSGAGISTDSGIPDYRGPKSAQRPRNPMRYQQFVGSEAARRHYWSRSLIGWPHIQQAKPNAAHYALARLEASGLLRGIITQNVDSLHQAAGSRNLLELHGRLAIVRCLQCRRAESRRTLQKRMSRLNPDFQITQSEIAPDGDADMAPDLLERFRVPACLHCHGILKPDVVFFGENVPKERVERAYHMLEHTDVLLVLGSSLTVFSGYRFVVRAVQSNKPVAIINQGPTRGDASAAVRLNAPLGEVLPLVVDALRARA